MSNRSIPRRLGDSRQFRRLVTQLARCVAERIWRRGVVQRWESEDELVDYLQQLGLFLGVARLGEWPDVFAEFTAAGFLVDEGEAIVLPILTADTLRVVPGQGPALSAEEQAAADKVLSDKALSMHIMRRARKGDALAILARNEHGTPEEQAARADAAAAAWAAIAAEYNHAERRRLDRRRGDRRGPVPDGNRPAVTDGTGPGNGRATAAGTGPAAVTPASEFSPSPGSGAPTPEPEREGNSGGAREAGAVTTPSVTNPPPVTAPAPTGPLTADELGRELPADVGQFFLDVMASRAPGALPTRADRVDATNLGAMIVARGASETDLRVIGGRWKHNPAKARALLNWALKPDERIPVSLLLGSKVDGEDGRPVYEGAMFGRLLSDAQGWIEDLAAKGQTPAVPTDPPFRRSARPGVVGTVDALGGRRGTGTE